MFCKSFLVYLTQNDRPLQFSRNRTEIFFKLQENQTFGLMKMHNMIKI